MTEDIQETCANCKWVDCSITEYPCVSCSHYDSKSNMNYFETGLYDEGNHDITEYDAVNNPYHYNQGMECIEEMIAVFGEEVVANFCLCNVWKYRKRAMYKNGTEDMDKSDWYMNKYIELKGCELY